MNFLTLFFFILLSIVCGNPTTEDAIPNPGLRTQLSSDGIFIEYFIVGFVIGFVIVMVVALCQSCCGTQKNYIVCNKHS